ncbi:MAG: DUF3656 domain-containing protein, partial [Planctomycetota bacterium]|nr:DUF3656 domain-containing protein [Planctomycetota bacterium]
APAGEWESLRAGVANGADAVYFGLRGFNARGRAENFATEELPEVMAYLHDRNVRGYVAVNTLVFANELDEAARCVEAVAKAGADAMIVQDLGLAALAARVAPGLALHASTQMTLSEAEGIAMARELGIGRVILARELSLEQVRDVAKAAAAVGVEVEVFVHGAICISCSGQCLASWARGGRSANRGQCAQPCRLEYDLVVDGQVQDTHGRRYLLSPGDLGAWPMVPELAAAGVRAVKIEGRLRGAEYVAAVTRMYRTAIDAEGTGGAGNIAETQAREGVGGDVGGGCCERTEAEGREETEETEETEGTEGKKKWEPGRELEEGLEQVYGRKLTKGFLGGARGEELVDGGAPDRRGVEVGVVRAAGADMVTIETRAGTRVEAGDGLAFGRPEGPERVGGRVYSVRKGASGRVEVKLAGEGMGEQAIEPGMTAWKTDDPAVGKRLRGSFTRVEPWRRERVDVRVEAVAGEPLAMEFTDGEGQSVRVVDAQALAEARNRPLTAAAAREQLGRLGETPFALGTVELVGAAGPAAEAGVMAPASAMNRLRREGVEELMKRRRERTRVEARAEGAVEGMRREFGSVWGEETDAEPQANWDARGEEGAGGVERVVKMQADGGGPRGGGSGGGRISVVARSMEQVRAVGEWAKGQGGLVDAVYADLAEAGQWEEAIEAAREAGCRAGLATPRMVTPGQEWVWERIVTAAPEAVRVRSLGALRVLRSRLPEAELVADFALNVVNDLSAGALTRWGVRRIVAGFDAGDPEAAAMLEHMPAGMLEARVYGRTPLFYTRYCLYGAHAGGGRECSQCGRPCRGRAVALRDRRGQELPVMTDAVGGNSVYAEAAAEKPGRVRRWREVGVRRFYVELTREGEQETRAVLQGAREVVGRRK